MSFLPAFPVAGGWLLCHQLSQNRAWHRWKLTQKKPYLKQFPNRPGPICWYNSIFWSAFSQHGTPSDVCHREASWLWMWILLTTTHFSYFHFPQVAHEGIRQVLVLVWGTNTFVRAKGECNCTIMTDINLRDMYLAPFVSITWSSSAEGHLGCYRGACASLCSTVKWQHSTWRTKVMLLFREERF